MINAKIYKCFISSPNDTQEEREICDQVFSEINETIGEKFNFRIESIRWEKDVQPGFGKNSAQELINRRIKDCQLYIGIMSTRFGTPTENAESGTVEEFFLAHERFTNSENDMSLMIYFNDNPPSSIHSIDPDQLKDVKAFRELISDKKGLYSNYKGTSDFKRKLTKHLQGFFLEDKDKNINTSWKILKLLQQRLEEALSMFSNQPTIWVDRTLCKPKRESKTSTEKTDDEIIVINDIVNNPHSMIINASPQFGLTCLSHYLIIEAWKINCLWLYIDMEKINKYPIDINKIVDREINKIGLNNKEINCFVIDSWKTSKSGSMKLLRGICSQYKDVPIIVMNTIGDFDFSSKESINIERQFDLLTLSALPRSSIRKVVSEYNAKKNIGDENMVLDKIITDIDILNIHRTPLNCLTLLKISEKHFDESPVNRTRMIEMVLFVLFDLVELPTYKSKPDVKDCEHILGYFCEQLIRNKQDEFDKNEFLEKLEMFCKQKLIDLDVMVVFNTLFDNRIIVNHEGKFRFKSVYWIYYFAAKQMHQNEDFFKYIIDSQQYSSFPLIIEFYTGIDRNRLDIIEILTKQLSDQCDIIEGKAGLHEDFNLLKYLKWDFSENIEESYQRIKEEVFASNLPDSVKDKYADKQYDSFKPYNQNISDILQEFTLLVLLGKIKSSSRALRNSDYVDAEAKKKLLKEITRGWYLFSKVFFALSPILASHGYASFYGYALVLSDDYNKFKPIDKIRNIILNVPFNILCMFKDDLFSKKIGPLLYDLIDVQKNKLIKHELILLLIFSRPRGWVKYIENYIKSIPKKSIYLFDVSASLEHICIYYFISGEEKHDIKRLIDMVHVKHHYGNKNLIDKMKSIPTNRLPRIITDK